MQDRRHLFLIFMMAMLLGFSSVLAKADLSLSVSDITFSKEEALAGDKVRIFARVFNVGDQDIYGFVVFSINGKEIAESQPVSVKVNAYDDVFIDWVFQEGIYNIEAEIAATRPADENSINDLALQEDFFIDLDSDHDGLGDTKDNDNDNDGLTDEKEKELGTDYLKPDTDQDGFNDAQDIFPLDATEWQDADDDGWGNNLDTDDDNDGLADEQELTLGTNPLSADTDQDLIPDKTEISIGFLKPDRNEWNLVRTGLDSMAGAVKSEVENSNLLIGRLFAAFGFLSIFWLILRFIKQRKS